MLQFPAIRSEIPFLKIFMILFILSLTCFVLRLQSTEGQESTDADSVANCPCDDEKFCHSLENAAVIYPNEQHVTFYNAKKSKSEVRF